LTYTQAHDHHDDDNEDKHEDAAAMAGDEEVSVYG